MSLHGFFVAAIAAVSLALGACQNTGQGSNAMDGHAGHDHGATQSVMYTCPMHPEVTSAAAGTCPKCGVNLVRK